MFDFSLIQSPWEVMLPERFQLAESPRAAHGQLRWVDINARTLHRLSLRDIQTARSDSQGAALGPLPFQTTDMPDQIACIVPTTDPEVWIGCGREGIWAIRDDGQHECMVRSPFDHQWQRFNDGCVDEWGRLWISTLIDDKRAPLASLYVLQNGKLHCVLQGLMTGNGMAYSAARRKLWLADTYTRTIRRFDIAPDTIDLHHDGWSYTYTGGTQRPDGACVLDDGSYLVAVIEGGRVDVFCGDDTQPTHAIPVAVIKPTMPCILPQPAPALVLSTADIARKESDAIAEGKASITANTDGHLLIKFIRNASATAFLYSR